MTSLLWISAIFAGIIMMVLAMKDLYYKEIPAFKFGVKRRIHSPIFKSLPPGEIIAFGWEAGYLPELLGSGPHFFIPFLEEIIVFDQPQFSSTEVAYVISQVGTANPNLKQIVPYDERFGNFDNVKAYLDAGGGQGQLGKVLRGGIRYSIHPAAFLILVKDKSAIGIPVPGSPYADPAKKSQMLLEVQDGAFKVATKFETISLKGFVAQGSDQHDVIWDIEAKVKLHTTEEIPFNMARVGGIENMLGMLSMMLSEQLLKTTVQRPSIEWPRYRDEFTRLVVEGVSGRFEKYNASIEEFMNRSVKIPEALREPLQVAATMQANIPRYMAQADMEAARGAAERYRGMADEMSALGRTEVEVQEYTINLEKVEAFAKITDIKSAHLKALVEMLSENKIRLNPSFQLEGRSIFSRMLDRADGTDTPGTNLELKDLAISFGEWLEKGANLKPEAKEFLLPIATKLKEFLTK